MKFVFQTSADLWGGNEKWLLAVARGLAERDHEILISCKPGRPVAEAAAAVGLRVTYARPAGDADLISALRFAAMLRREKPHALLLTNFRRTFTGGWAARRAGVPRVVVRHSLERPLPRKWKYQLVFRHYVDAMLVNSEAIRELWLDSAPWFPRQRVHVVYNGVTLPAGVSRIRAELGISDATPLVAAAGALEPRKGFDILLNAFAQLRDADAHLVVAGAGTQAEALLRLATRLGVAPRVHWLGFRRDVQNVLLGADVFAHASRHEGMANVMLEAMAAECLVVATDVFGAREAMDARRGRPEVGWIVPINDASAFAHSLAEAVQLIRSKGPELDTRHAEMRYRVENWFTVERMVEETDQVLAMGS